MKLLIILVMSLGSVALANDPNNTTTPKHLVQDFKDQTCAFSAKQTEAQKQSRSYKPSGKANQ
jgi:hypothetical protein